MTTSSTPIDVRHDAAAGTFEAIVDGLACRAYYRLDGDVMRIYHTEVPAVLEGRGIASRLVGAAFRHAEANNLRVLPQCSYAAAWLQRHPELAHLAA